MYSPGINGEGKLRGQPANPGSPGKIAIKTVCVCVCVQLAVYVHTVCIVASVCFTVITRPLLLLLMLLLLMKMKMMMMMYWTLRMNSLLMKVALLDLTTAWRQDDVRILQDENKCSVTHTAM